MRVSLVADDLCSKMINRHLIAQACLFQQRGDEVYLYLSALPASLPDKFPDSVAISTGSLGTSELYLFHYACDYSLLGGLRKQDQGTVLVHDHVTVPDPEEWLPAFYADICLVSNSERYKNLVAGYDLPSERIHLVPGPDDEVSYQAALNRLVDQAVNDTWPSTLRIETATASPGSDQPRLEQRGVDLGASLNLARTQTDVMLRDYAVRSRLPLVGGLVAWIRRNLTSHLREPYIDPTFERQVAFNRTVAVWMEQVQARLQQLEAQVDSLQGPKSSAGQADSQDAETNSSASTE